MKILKKFFAAVIAMSVFLTLCSCDEKNSDANVYQNGAESVVPSKSELIENTEDAGYKVSESDNIYDLDVSGVKVFAEKGDSFIDICYGLNSDDAIKVYDYYEEKYAPKLKSGDYYILARNENFVYYISDKTAFKKSGFTSTDNIGTQHIKG